MTAAHRSALLLAGLLGACAGAPPSPVGAVPTPPTPGPATPPPASAPATTRDPRLTRLENGVAVAIREATGADAQLQLGFLSGASFAAPGLAELSTWTLLEDGDASQGQASLQQAIRRLGGTVRLQVGPLTTWLDLRVPGDRWQQALAAVQTALTVPSQSRHQLLRMRDDLVATRVAEVRQQPLRAMARAMLLGDRSTSDYVRGLLDRDPGEVSLFRSRLFRPERAVLSLEVPGDPAVVAKQLEQAGAQGFAGWRPPAPVPGTVPMLERSVARGAHWAPSGRAEPCQVGIVMLLPDLAVNGPRTPSLLLLQCCLTMDGTGGRLEQLSRERGLGQVRWQSELVQTADAVALLLTARMDAADAARVWPTLELARRSLRDVPPSASELALAARRAHLTASLGQLEARSRLRAETSMLVRGQTLTSLEQGLSELTTTGLDPLAAPEFLQLPAAVVVVGGIVPDGTQEVATFDLLPSGFAPEAVATDTKAPAATAAPWLARAIDAAGGKDLVRRFAGYRAETRLVQEKAPAAADTFTWRDDGTLTRSRQLLGQEIVTTVTKTGGSEAIGAERQPLSDAEVATLRREFARHPLALLAAAARGELEFRAIAQREVGDRQFIVLEALGDRFDRLRLHIDTVSHLVRVVESWETLPDATLLHLQEEWSDYRDAAGLRLPFHRFTVFDDGENRVETVFARCQPQLRAP